MKIPSKFKFLGLEFKVKLVSIIDQSNLNIVGRTDMNNQIILIKKGMPKQAIELTFLHELTHVLFSQMGIDKALKMDSEAEEVVVNAFSNGLYGLIANGTIKC